MLAMMVVTMTVVICGVYLLGTTEEKKQSVDTCISEYRALWKSDLKQKETSYAQYRKGRGCFLKPSWIHSPKQTEL